MKIGFFPGSFKPPHIGHFYLVKKTLPLVDSFYILISSKSRDNINATQSKKIWEIYLKDLKDFKKVNIIITEKSPLLEIFKLIKKINLQKGDTVYLLKSDKNVNNKRFDMFKKLNLIELVIPKFKTISSTNMRKAIQDKDYNTFIKFLPKELNKKEQKQIYNILV